MANRREILQAAAAATAASAAGSIARAGQSEELALPAAVVIDRRFDASRAFGGLMARRGLGVHEIEGDVTDLWLREIKPLWGRDDAPVVGLTARSALFCFEQLAWEHRRRVVYHAEHTARPDGGLEHRILTSGSGYAATDYAEAGERWPTMASMVVGGPRWTPAEARGPSPAGLAPAHEHGLETLATWVIAPVRKSPILSV